MPSAIDTSIADHPANTHSRRASLKILSRNIKQVVLGDLVFDTWYYSPYPDSIIQESGTTQPSHYHRHGDNHTNGIGPPHHHHPSTLKSSISSSGPACPRLYVCPSCFRYSPSEQFYVSHLHHHEQVKREASEEEEEVNPVPETAFKVYEWDGYTVWEVDGETEKLYCQNLSLFGKLFLEQKSVFFDTAGFKYYVLTHTRSTVVDNPQQQQQQQLLKSSSSPPSTRKGRTTRKSGSSLTSPTQQQPKEDEKLKEFTFETQVLGFFSKENLSWDSNNLACILIFPPFQRRQLGQLLMAVSYKLSGWEWEGGVIGGPEKPLSAMGRKSYLRFWSERIVRFTMGQTADADGSRVFDKVRKKKKKKRQRRLSKPAKLPQRRIKEEMTIKEIGDRTGMLPEDVIAALTDMGVCDVKSRRGAKKTTTNRQKKVVTTMDGPLKHQEMVMRNGTNTAAVNSGNATAMLSMTVEAAQNHASGGHEEVPPATMTVLRSRIVAWAQTNHVDIAGPVKEEGFLGEWALSDADAEEEEEDDDEDEEGEDETANTDSSGNESE